jgi:glutathione S-transferase
VHRPFVLLREVEVDGHGLPQPSYAERDELLLNKPLGVLNDVLVGRDYLVGNNFTVADLNVASILVWGKMARLNLSGHLARICARCLVCGTRRVAAK